MAKEFKQVSTEKPARPEKTTPAAKVSRRKASTKPKKGAAKRKR